MYIQNVSIKFWSSWIIVKFYENYKICNLKDFGGGRSIYS